jgi:hypothetical protein
MASGVKVGLAGFPVYEQRHMRWAGSIFVKASIMMLGKSNSDALLCKISIIVRKCYGDKFKGHLLKSYA